MRLHLADYHLESARLHLARDNQDNLDEARKHLDHACTMIKDIGYHRRDNEVNEISRKLQ